METINSITSAATKAIWGDNSQGNQQTGTEPNPTSTTTATTTNTDTDTNTNTNTNTSDMNNETRGQEPISGVQGDTSKGEPFDAGNIETGETAVSKGPTTEHPSTTGNTGGFKAAQADIRDPESSATTDPKTETARKNVDDKDGLDSSENPAKVEGAGPRPVEEVARERGGDAGRVGETGASSSTKEGELDQAENKDSKGTGEEYVKSSGLNADGGDFDATKPGAGREADRLLEAKGMTTQTAAAAGAKKDKEEDAAAASPASPASPDSKEKKSLKDKIKAKLHKDKN